MPASNGRQNIRDLATHGQWRRAYTYTDDNGAMDLTGVVFGFTVRPNVADATVPPLVVVRSDTSSSQGSITVTANTVYVTLSATATALLTGYSYAYALYWDPDEADQEPDVAGIVFPQPVVAP